MKHLLRAGAMTPAAVADELDVKEETVKRTMRDTSRIGMAGSMSIVNRSCASRRASITWSDRGARETMNPR